MRHFLSDLSGTKLTTLAKLTGGVAVLMLFAVALSGSSHDTSRLAASVYTFASGPSMSISANPAAVYAGSMDSAVTWSTTGSLPPGSCSLTASPALSPTNQNYDPTDFLAAGTFPISMEMPNIYQVNGTWYIAGSYVYKSSTSYGANTEIYSASASDLTTWTDTGQQLPAKEYGGATAVIGNNVYIFGGNDDEILAASTSNPTHWIDTGKSIPYPKNYKPVYANLIILGNDMYLMGGEGNYIMTASTSDPTSWAKSAKTTPFNADYGTNLAVVGDYIYSFGGGYIGNGKNDQAIYRAPVSDPTNWVNTGKTIPAAGIIMTLFNDGTTLYLYGGYDGYGNVQHIYTASVLDPLTWTDTGRFLPVPYGELQSPGIATSTSGALYFIGGYWNNGNSKYGATNLIITDAPSADPTNWANTMLTQPGTIRDSQIAAIGNNLYAFGGQGDATIYTASTSNPMKWVSTGKSLPAKLEASQLAIVGNSMYLLGGQVGNPVANIYAASTSNPTVWVDTKKTLPAALMNSQLAIIGDSMYLFGGIINSGAGVTNAIYTASTSNPYVWKTASKSLPDSLGVSQLAIVGKSMYLFGGWSGSGGTSAIYAASTSNPYVWTKASRSLPNNPYASQLAIIGNNMYLFGGYGDTNIYTASTSNPYVWIDTGMNIPSSPGYQQFVFAGYRAYLIGGTSNVTFEAAISPTAPLAAYGMPPWHTDGQSNMGQVQPITQTTTYTLTCTDKTNDTESVSTTVTVYPPPSISLTASMLDGTSTLSWNVQYANLCNLSGPNLSSALVGLSGSLQAQPKVDPATYTMTCQAPLSTISQSATAQSNYYYAAIRKLPSFGSDDGRNAGIDGTNLVLNGWPAPLGCTDGSSIKETCARDGYQTTYGVFSIFDPANTANGATTYFQSQTAQSRHNVDWDSSGAWTSTVTQAPALSATPGTPLTLEWACTPSQRQWFTDECGVFGLNQCWVTGDNTDKNLFNTSSSTNFSTSASPKNYTTIYAPSTSKTYYLQCKPTEAGDPLGPVLSLTVNPVGANTPVAQIEANASGYGKAVSTTVGNTVTLHANFQVKSGDSAVKTSIIDSALNKLSGISETPPSLDKTTTVTPTSPGTYIFYPSIQTTLYPAWNSYSGSVQVTASCTDPHAAGTNCSTCQSGYAQDAHGVCQVDYCTDTDGLQSSIPAHAASDAATTGICQPCATGYGWSAQANQCVITVALPTVSLCSNNTLPSAPGCAFNVLPSTVRSGGSIKLYWDIENLASTNTCSITASPTISNLPSPWDQSGTSWTNLTGASITVPSKTTFTLSCKASDGTSVSLQKTVTIVPSYQEI
ncbi:MAG TPA: hypothetical protein VG753_02920 [Candidatus Paceibacterota bacterium]|nr:hypothetical protein [Candidatus Paceibacterota bacterium]